MANEIQNTNLYERIAGLLEQAKNHVRSVVNLSMVYTNYEIGRMIVEDEQKGSLRAEYGKTVLKDLSKRLTEQFGRGYSVDSLQNMRRFYIVYSNSPQIEENGSPQIEIHQEATNQSIEKYENDFRIFGSHHNFALGWCHYLFLMRIENADERRFYEIECQANDWKLEELKRQFNSGLYERLALSKDKEGVMELARQGQLVRKPSDVVKDPYVLEFLGLPELPRYSESDLENKIIDNLQKFLLELGKGFTFVERQARLTFDEQHYRVDLVFYNRFTRSFVLLDLKIGELKHQDIGQMQMYVNYYDRKVKLPEENPTIGILLCKDKIQSLVEMTLPLDNSQIYASKYLEVLPSKEDLKRLLDEKED
ncbi:MAG: DUF1016 family protein [Muribaculaceae bacterium]|nr:DUF1016 family protein [Muribaculaceae bacterium]